MVKVMERERDRKIDYFYKNRMKIIDREKKK